MGSYLRGIQEYQKLMALSNKTATLGEIPAYAVALLQIADGYAALGNEERRFAALLELYERVVNHPWDISAGVSYYLNQISRQLAESAGLWRGQGAAEETHKLEELKKREKELFENIHFLEWVRETLVPQIQPGSIGNSISQPQRHLSAKLDNVLVQFGMCRLAAAPPASAAATLGYQLDQEYIVTGLLPTILSRVDLGKDVGVGIVDEVGRVRFPQVNHQVSKHLAAESFSLILPGWKVVLFHREGKSIEELVRKEKRIFLAFLFGTVFLMAAGVFLTVRAAAHELEVSRMKAEFVSRVSHEFKTPLSVIRMFGETLESGIVQDEAKRQEFSSIIRKESERLTHLINNVLDFSKIDAGRKQYNLCEADVVGIVQSALETSRLQNRDLGFTIEVSLPCRPVIIRVDPDALSQALLNLLDNAAKYSNEKKYIGVKVSKGESSVSIAVEDRGVGIPKEELGKVFDKFYRGQARKNRDVPGSGLGLTLVKHIAEAHKGKIKVESVEGQGSKFTLELPLGG
jgi:signal transduction histidine kinase